MMTLFKHLITNHDDKGKEMLDGTRFLDWPSSPNVKGVDAGLQALMVMAMDAGNEMALALGDKELAERLMLLGGQNVELHYKEYFGSLPWRGMTRYVVDSIVAARPIYYQPTPPPVGELPFKGQEI